MYDKTVRRRRAVLALLVGLSLVLLTLYFGESSGGGLHSAQRGVLSVLSPIQEGASRALKPVRDLAGWFGDTIDAKGQRDKLEKENRTLRAEAIAAQAARQENAQLRQQVQFSSANNLGQYQPVTARVIFRSPNLWYATVFVDKGSGAGLRVNQPVVNGDGLVGEITSVTSNSAEVTLITDHTSGVPARVLAVNGQAGPYGVLQTEIGKPTDLLLNFVAKGSNVRPGDRVATAGTVSSRKDLGSLFPPDIPIGRVTRVEDRQSTLDQRVHVKPYADLSTLDFVQVLTKPSSTARAQVP